LRRGSGRSRRGSGSRRLGPAHAIQGVGQRQHPLRRSATGLLFGQPPQLRRTRHVHPDRQPRCALAASRTGDTTQSRATPVRKPYRVGHKARRYYWVYGRATGEAGSRSHPSGEQSRRPIVDATSLNTWTAQHSIDLARCNTRLMGLLKKGLHRVPGSSPRGAAIIRPAIDWGRARHCRIFQQAHA
jgi:hypothetical protein